MSLSSLIRGKSKPVGFATATPATFATQEGERGRTVASVATVAVAKSPQGQTAPPAKVGAGDTATASRWWLIHYPDRDPLEVACCPEATHAEILERHPDAVAAEAFTPTIRQPSAPLTASEETAIRAWLALIEETDPAGMTERHLIEELATIIWRKRRVLLAEGAKINEGLKCAVKSAASVIKSATPFQRGIGGEDADLLEFMDGTPEEIAERQRDAALDLAATRKAAAILRKGGPNAYAKARRALVQESRDWWDEHVEEEEHPATAEGLAEFIRDSLEPICYRMVKEAEYTPAIKAQTLGEGLQAHRLEKLNRYETHLDRKFERTLAMLLKLKDLRGA